MSTRNRLRRRRWRLVAALVVVSPAAAINPVLVGPDARDHRTAGNLPRRP